MTLVFDFGGVVFRWAPQELLAQVLPQRIGDPAAAQHWVDLFFQDYGGDWGDFDRGVVEPGPLAERIARRTGLEVDEVRRVIDAVPGHLQPVPAMATLLRALHAAGHSLYFLSNMPEPYARHLEATHDILSLFRGGVFSARVRLCKPAPEIYAHCTRTFGLDPARTLFIDDSSRNITAAQAAGWQGLRFLDAAQCERELRERALL